MDSEHVEGFKPLSMCRFQKRGALCGVQRFDLISWSTCPWRLNALRYVIVFVPPSFGSVVELRNFITSSWYEICGKRSEGHLQAGTYVEEVRSWKQATSYMERYVAKPEVFPEGVETGRVWEVWNEDLLPIQWETVKVSREDAYKIRRICRRLAKIKGRRHLCRLTVFVRHENVVRLLEFLGYRQEE